MQYLLSSQKNKSIKHAAICCMLLFAISATNHLAAQTTVDTSQKFTAIGTSKVWGIVDGIAIEGLVQSPSSANAPLQIACVFEYTEDDIYKSPPALPANLNGMVHVDKGLNGLITDIRKSGKFKGHAFETLLIIPAPVPSHQKNYYSLVLVTEINSTQT